MRFRLDLFCFGLALSLASAACMPRRPTSRVKDMDAGHDKARWLAKTVRVLHYRRDLQDVPNYQELLNKSRSDAVDALMADPQFGDSVLDFGLFFLGFQPDDLRSNYDEHTYRLEDFEVGGFPQAIHAAQEVVSGGDFFTLFDRWQPRYLRKTSFYANKDGLPSGISDADARSEHLKRATESIKTVIDLLGKATSREACDAINQAQQKFDEDLSNSGLNLFDFDVDLSIIGCFIPNGTFNFAEAKAKKEIQYKWLVELQQHREEWIANIKPAKNVLEIPLVDLFQVPGSKKLEAFASRFYAAKPNSSTNANRRRAAYMLNTFFCDDLTPLNVALPAAHAGQSAHGSDPACQACHYKLDPMAGFFRSRGIVGLDFSNLPNFIFDDQKNIMGDELTKYMNSWREPIAEQAGTRPWRVGYVRSADLNSPKNTWGESYDDLFKIIREAPEVKQCLTRRMAEYYIGNNLVFDGAWIRQLSKKFENAQGPATSSAFKDIVKEMVLSKTFTMDNPNADQCYDFASTGQSSPLPCKVADIVTRNCGGCHSSTEGPGKLNLKSWSKGPDGAFSFEHNGGDGQRLPKNVTFGRIMERLSTPDKSRLMPLMKTMPDVERATLYKWVNDESSKPH